MCNISRSSKDAVGLREERNCELRYAWHSSHTPMSAHLKSISLWKSSEKITNGFATSLTQATVGIYLIIIWQKGGALEMGHVWALYLRITGPSRAAPQLHIYIQICTAWWDMRRWEAWALLIILQPFLQSRLWTNRSWRRGSIWFNAEVQKDVAPLVLSPNHFFPKATKSFKEETDTVGGWGLTGVWIQILAY